MKKQNVEKMVVDLLINVYKQKSNILDTMPLDIDSMDKLEIAMWAEKEFGIEIYDDELMGWASLSDIVNTIKEKRDQL